MWGRHFERVLNEGGSSEVDGGKELGSGFELLNEAMRREVVQALAGLKQKAAPSSDGLTVEMIGSKVLVDFWLWFNWCWRYGMIPSEWRRSTCSGAHSKEKKRSGVCRTDEFWGKLLVPVVYKAMCIIIQGRLRHVVEERNLVAEEQGEF